MANLNIAIKIAAQDQASGPIRHINNALGGLADTGQRGFAGLQTAVMGMGVAFVAGAAVAGAAAVGLGVKLIGLGSDAEEMQGKFDVVFANVGGQVTERLDAFAEAAGRSRFELMEMASTLGDTLKPMGFTEAAAGDMAVQLTQLAVDLGSFNNMPMDEALRRLQGTLIGSHENALAFGVIINENTLAAELAANGWDELTGAELEQAKVQARLNLLMRGTTDAQGDAIRTSGSWANQMRALQATLKDAGTEIGLTLLPAVTPLLAMVGDLARDALPALGAIINNTVVPAIAGVSQFIQTFVTAMREGEGPIAALQLALQTAFGADVATRVMEIVTGIQDFIGQVTTALTPITEFVSQFVSWQDVLMALGVVIASIVIPIIGSIISAVLPVIAVGALLIAGIALVRNAWENDWGGIQGKVEAVIGFVVPLVTNAIQFIRDWWAANGEAVLAKANEVWTAIQTAIQTAITTVQTVVTTVATALQTFWAANGEAILAKANEVWTAIQTAIQTAITTVQTVVTTVATALQTFWDAHGELILATAQRIWTTILEYITGVWDTISALFAAFKSAFQGDWEGFGENLRLAWDTAWETIVNYIRNLWGIVAPILADFVFAAINYLQGINWGEVGTNIIQGIANGITGAAGFLVDAARAAAQAALDAAKAFLGISSPSRLAAELIGKPFSQGVAQGILAAAGTIDVAVNRVMNMPAPGQSRQGGMLAAAGGGISQQTIINIDARGAASGVGTDIERAIEKAFRQQGTRADIIRRTR